MEDNNLFLNIISEPTPTKSRLIGKNSVVGLKDFLFSKKRILFILETKT